MIDRKDVEEPGNWNQGVYMAGRTNGGGRAKKLDEIVKSNKLKGTSRGGKL